MRMKAVLAIALVAAVSPASGQVVLNQVGSFARNPYETFGMMYDGTNIWYSSFNVAYQVDKNTGANTGVSRNLAVGGGQGWSALAYDPATNSILTTGYYGTGNTSQVNFVNITTGALVKSVSQPIGNFLVDGFDYDHGEFWWSGDVNSVYRMGYDGVSLSTGAATLWQAGSYSGVERVDVGANTYVFTVDDGADPRELCVNKLDATNLGCFAFANDRYEDLAFDGRYLWAADYYGGKLDKFDVVVDGEHILDVTPEPASLALLATGLVGFGAFVRRRQKNNS